MNGDTTRGLPLEEVREDVKEFTTWGDVEGGDALPTRELEEDRVTPPPTPMLVESVVPTAEVEERLRPGLLPPVEDDAGSVVPVDHVICWVLVIIDVVDAIGVAH